MTNRREDVRGGEVTGARVNARKPVGAGIWLAALVCVSLVLPVAAQAVTVLPGYRAPLVTEPATPSTFRTGMSSANPGGPKTDDPEITELARGLKYDPGLMYKFVHDHIKFEPTWGEVKGPYMTWMDRSGNGFDQAALMIALLEEAAEHHPTLTITDPNFVVGEIQLSASEAISWLDIPDDADVAERMLARSGFYATVTDDGSGGISSINLEHVWVKVTIDSTTYRFDPSFKTHDTESGIWNLYQAMGFYQSYIFYDEATETGTGKIFHRDNIEKELTKYSANLVDYIKDPSNNLGGADMIDIIGGRRIEPVAESNMPPSAPPYSIVQGQNENDVFGLRDIPAMYRTTLRIQHEGLDETFFSSDIYGRRLTLQYYGANNQPQLVLDGTVQDTGNATNSEQAYDLTLSVDHPYESTTFDVTTTVSVVSDGFYQIISGWGNTGTQILRKHRDDLEEYRHDGNGDTSEQVLGQSYALLGMTWLAQNSRVRSMGAEITDTTVVNHHLVGLAGQSGSGGTPYIDMPLGSIGVTVDADDDEDKRRAVFYSLAGFSSAYEHQVIRQVLDCNAVSTIKLIDMVYDPNVTNSMLTATSANWSGTIEPQLDDYTQAEKDQIEDYLDDGYSVHLPESADLTLDDWEGTGFRATHSDASCLSISHIISGGYSGGAATVEGALSPSTVFDNAYGAEQGRRGDGAYGFGSTDLSIGSGGYPFGLSFSRKYSTRRRFEDGPLGLGWTHNLDIQALVKSDSFQFLGVDSPIDAARQIVSFYVSWDMIDDQGWDGNAIAAICENWLMRQMTDQVVVIKRGSGSTTFVKDPNGTYHGPSDGSLRLTTDPNGYFRLKSSDGTFKDFDSEGRISQWKDAHGNTVDFTYTSGKLTQVASKIGGSATSRYLTLSYDGDYISSVSDSAGRSVSYDYDGSDQMIEFENLDGNDVTYGYESGEDGLISEVFSPIDDVNAILTVVYDDLGRMIQQVDANGCTWDYYLATYRSEVMGPNQIDPNDLQSKRFSTIRWSNPEARTTTRIDVMERETVSGYDGRLRTEAVLYPSGMSTEYGYDENDRVDEVKSVSIASSGDGTLTTYRSYGSFENATGYWFVDPNQTTDGAGNITKYEYDYDPNFSAEPDRGLLMKITYPPVDAPTDMNRPTVQYTYNSYGQILTKTDAEGMVTAYEYYDPNQGAGLKKVVVDYNDATPTDNLNLTTEYTYDSVGRVISIKDPRGYVSEREYYPSGLLKETTGPESCGCQNRTYEYYKDGKLKHVKTYLSSSGGSSGSGNDYSSDPNCAALWSLEDGALTTDSIGSNTLTNSGAVASSTHQEGSYSADFETGDTDYMAITDASLDSGFPLKNGDTNKKISVAFWMRPESLPASSGISRALVSKYDSTNNARSFAVVIAALGSNINLGMWIGHSNGTTAEAQYAGSPYITAGKWYHVAATYDDSTKTGVIRWYDVDADTTSTSTLTFTNNINVENAGWNISGISSSGLIGFDGLVDEVAVFNDILTSTEIDEIRAGTYGDSSSSTSGDCIYLQTIEYNKRGQKKSIRGPYAEDATPAEMQVNYTTYDYDALGRLTLVTDAEGAATLTQYYPDGKVWKVTDSEGNDTVTNTYNTDGSLQKVTDAEDNETEYTYTGFMQPERVTFEDDTYEELQYDSARRVVQKTTRMGQEITLIYDALGRVKTKDIDDPENTITYKYDLVGRLLRTVDDTGTTTNAYDTAGRVIDVNSPGGKVVSYEYDAAGNRTKLTYPDDSYITYEYDPANRLTAIKDDSATPVTLASYTYDDLSRRSDLTYANGASIDYTYDTAGRLLDVNNVTDTGQLKYSYVYDDVGNRTSMSVTDSGGTSTTVYDYDNVYQLTDVDYPADMNVLAIDTEFNYDGVGNRTSVVDANGTVSYTTNELNQYTAVADATFDYDDNGNTTYDGTYTYDYDAENRLIVVEQASAGGGPLSAACDTGLALTTGGDASWTVVTDESYYDGDSACSGAIGDDEETWLQTTVEGTGTVSFWWKVSSAAGDEINFYIDDTWKAGRSGTSGWIEVTKEITTAGMHTLKWTYSKNSSGSAGSDCAWVDYVQFGAGAPVAALATALDTELPVTTGGDGDWSVSTWPSPYYGSQATRSADVDDYEESVMETAGYGPGTVSFYWRVSSEEDYDWLEFYIDDVRQDRISGSSASWQLKSYTVEGEGKHAFKWRYVKDSGTSDGWDRGYVDYLQWTGDAEPETSEWAEIEYTYDPSGRRIAKNVDGVVTKYVYDGIHCIAEYDGSNNLLRKYIYGPSVDQPISMIDVNDSNAVYYYHYDALGSVVALSDADGDTAQIYEYDAYGQVATYPPDDTNPFLFTGRRYDTETGLYYYRARHYNPTIGRFLQADPIGYQGGMNLYRYCNNNPWNMVDPFGRDGEYEHDGTYDTNEDAVVSEGNCAGGEIYQALKQVGWENAYIGNAMAAEAMAETEARGLDGEGSGHNGPGDAFRHCYWSCRMTHEMDADTADKIGRIHEDCAQGQPDYERNMDLYNNSQGREIAERGGDCAVECNIAMYNDSLQWGVGGGNILSPLSSETP